MIEFVKNLDRVQQRWEAWWEGTLDKGPIVSATAPLAEPREPPLSSDIPSNVHDMWHDTSFRSIAARNNVMSTWYGGDAVPNFWVNFGPGSVAAYLGAPVTYEWITVWFHRLADNSLENIEASLAYDPDNELWTATRDLTEEAARLAEGEYLVAFADVGTALDILASLRGNQELLLDLIESPDLVNRCQDKILELWCRYFSELKSIFDDAGQDGYTCWVPAWSSRPWYVLQCDISAMISPDMFAELVLPNLRKNVEWLDRSMYHWDGPGAIQHLDNLLSIEKLNAIQWVAGAGNPPEESEAWLPYYRKIAESGKGIIFHATDPDKVFEISQKLPAERLAFSIDLGSPEEGEEFLARFDID